MHTLVEACGASMCACTDDTHARTEKREGGERLPVMVTVGVESRRSLLASSCLEPGIDLNVTFMFWLLAAARLKKSSQHRHS